MIKLLVMYIYPKIIKKASQEFLNLLGFFTFRIVETLILLGKKLGCYKISLECKDPLLTFYTQFGLKHEDKQNYLCKRFFH